MTDDEPMHSVNLLDYVYNEGVPGLDDPAENYFEASKLYRDSLPWDTPGVPILMHSRELQEITKRAGRRYECVPRIALPASAALSCELTDVLARRRSAPVFGGGIIDLPTLAGVLRHAYGVVRQPDGQPRRGTPSGGALYPLDIYVLARRVDGLAAGLYHFDAFDSALAALGSVDFDAVERLSLLPEITTDAAAVLVISASFWRSRFKYSQRSLRFVLIEAGHLAQNMLLLATGYQLTSRMFGGFIDDELTAMLPGHNGVDDAPVYMVMLGSGADSDQ